MSKIETKEAGTKIEQLAKVVGMSIDRLITLLDKAGINVNSAEQTITDEQKQVLLNYLKTSRNEEKPISTKMMLSRKKAPTAEATETLVLQLFVKNVSVLFQANLKKV
jgi:hypothetical protein